MNPGFWGIVVIVVAALLLFGRGKISGMMGEVAQGIRAFQKGMKDDDQPAAQIDASSTTKEPEKTTDA